MVPDLMCRVREQVWDTEWIVAAGAALQGEQAGVQQAERAVLKVHLVVDTGLGREGCLPTDALPLARMVWEHVRERARERKSMGRCCVRSPRSEGACLSLSGRRWWPLPGPERLLASWV
jgi:hypothetical protein